jgi:CubicO group peptidase (beta-lactamase class C family)
MQLKIKRSQRTGGVLGGKIIFALDARAELSKEEASLIKKYGLGKIAVYDSEARKKNAATAYGHFDSGASGGWDAASSARGMWSNARGLARVAMAALSLRVTVDSLVTGEHRMQGPR